MRTKDDVNLEGGPSAASDFSIGLQFILGYLLIQNNNKRKSSQFLKKIVGKTVKIAIKLKILP
jgi:hypothetical protein